MLSQAPLQSHHGYNQSHLQSSNPKHAYSQLSSEPDRRNHYQTSNQNSNGNLQAGRKRRESEIDSTNDSGENNNVRRRISRACDQCNQLRTKCDGKHPCQHCNEIGIQCEYARAHKKRGRAPKRDQEKSADEHSFTNNAPVVQSAPDDRRPRAMSRKNSSTSYVDNQNAQDTTIPSNTTPTSGTFDVGHQSSYYNNYNGASNIAMNRNSGMHDSVVPSMIPQHYPVSNPAAFNAAPLETLSSQNGMQQGFGFPLGDDYSVAFMGKAPMVESPDWMALNTPMYMTKGQHIPTQSRPSDTLRSTLR